MQLRLAHLLTAALLIAASTSSFAQGIVYLLGDEATNGDDFGRAVGDAGDIDMDGHPDVIVGAPFDDVNGASSGSVFVYSGRTGELLWTKAGEAAGDAFGWAVDGVGDVNGDGVGDVLIGAPLAEQSTSSPLNGGKVYLVSGANQHAFVTWSSAEANGQFGSTVRGLGDITGDGVGDYAIGSPWHDYQGLVDRGVMHVYSGAGAVNLFVRRGDEAGAKYGQSFDVVRATGAQATSRLIVGEPGVDGLGIDRGQARLLDGFGNIVSYLPGSTNNEYSGTCVAGIGDANNDGLEDYAIGAPYADILFVGNDAGTVRVYSGASTTNIYSVNGPSAGALFGQAISGFADFDGDGRDDFLLGAPNHDSPGVDSGEVRVVSGLNGATLASYSGGNNDHVGRSVSSAGDLNLDGIADFVFGANDAPFGEGQAQVHLSMSATPSVYCTAKVNSQGCTPQISTQGTASVSIADDFHVLAEDVINQQFGILFWSGASANTPFLGGTLCVQGPQIRTNVQSSGGNAAGTDCSGSYSFHFSQAYMSSEFIHAGDRIHAQFWSRDPAASFGVGLTDAVAFDVVP